MMIFCVQCEKNVDAESVTGKEIYPHREDLYAKKFYRCPMCGNYVGTHIESGEPLGCIPTKALRERRQEIHAKLDWMWKEKLISRKKLYQKLSDMLGYTYHTGDVKSFEECDKIMLCVKKIREEIYAIR